MESVSHMLERVPQAVQLGFAGVGAIYIGSKLLSYLQLVLSAFVLSGTNVGHSLRQCSHIV